MKTAPHVVMAKAEVSKLLADAQLEFKKIAGLVKGQAESLHFIYKSNDFGQMANWALIGAISTEQLQYILADIRHEYYRAADNHLAPSDCLYYLQKAVATQAFINQLRGR